MCYQERNGIPGSIHRDDEIGIIMLALEDERVQGPLNLMAPEPPTNREFYKALGKQKDHGIQVHP